MEIGEVYDKVLLAIREDVRILTQLKKEIENLVGENKCDGACLGTGKTVSGLPCICGGSGKAIDGREFLRKQLYLAKSFRTNLATAACRQLLIECRSKVPTEIAGGFDTISIDRIVDEAEKQIDVVYKELFKRKEKEQ